MKRITHFVGIDPGVNTGFAVWLPEIKQLSFVASLPIHDAMRRVDEIHRQAGEGLFVVFEDARARKWFGNSGREQLQGAGSIKRDSKIWADYLTDLRIPFAAISPQAKGAKWDAGRFKRITGWPHKTNEHGRDAALLVYGRKANGVGL